MADKEYTTIEETVDLEFGLYARSCAIIVNSCREYYETHNKREVFFYDGPFEVNGLEIMGLLALEAHKGKILKIKVEGVDNEAKSFAAELQRGLREEGHLEKLFKEIVKRRNERK